MTLIALTHRTIIEIKGEDTVAYLQGLTTNDMTRLRAGACLYTVFLNPQGKFINDAFAIMLAADHIWLDVEAEHAIALLKKLTMYKLRSNVTLGLRVDIGVYACFDESTFESDALVMQDPRTEDMGKRIYTTALQTQASTDISVYDKRRISLCVPDGARDVPYERGFVMEYGFHQLNAIDFQKGCYVGQELTARMHYRKLGKRQLVCVEFETNAPASGTEIMQNGLSVGVLRSTCGSHALAHIKSEALETNGVFMADEKKLLVCTQLLGKE
ncbi:MAG: folate-binding protein [Pseudomonadota bacterium]